MAFTVKLITAMPSDIESEVKTYLDAQSITTLHSISTTKVGRYIACLIVFE